MGYWGVEKREENLDRDVQWHIAMRLGKRRALGRSNMGRMLESYEQSKASLRSRVEHPISRHLGISIATTKAHAETLYQRLDAHSRNEAVYVAIARGATLGWQQLDGHPATIAPNFPTHPIRGP